MNFTALIWIPTVGEWMHIEQGQPIALYRNAFDFANRISIADPFNNTEKWKQALDVIGGEDVWKP
jgi:hypothetical protein